MTKIDNKKLKFYIRVIPGLIFIVIGIVLLNISIDNSEDMGALGEVLIASIFFIAGGALIISATIDRFNIIQYFANKSAKHIWQKWWFWAIIFILMVVGILYLAILLS